MNCLIQFLKSSIGKKQIVAATGLFLIVFLVGHLLGNLLIYSGPEAYNAYAHKLMNLRPGLYVIEYGLLIVFVIHIWFTALIVIENITARGKSYFTYRDVGQRSLATRLMPYTGTVLLLFVIRHLMDFTFVDHDGILSVMPDGRALGLYGVMYNSFMDPLNSAFYIVAMGALGFHLAHGIKSFAQTFGFDRCSNTPCAFRISTWIGIFFAFAFSSIPFYILWDSLKYNVR